MKKHLIYHFSFPCEFHGERFSHGPGETSEPVINPFRRRSERAAISSWCGVKSAKSKRTAKKRKVPDRRCEFLSASQNTLSVASAQTLRVLLACLSVCLPVKRLPLLLVNGLTPPTGALKPPPRSAPLCACPTFVSVTINTHDTREVFLRNDINVPRKTGLPSHETPRSYTSYSPFSVCMKSDRRLRNNISV